MPISDAKMFLKDLTVSETLRDSLYDAASRNEISDILKAIPYEFNNDELDNAYRNLLVNCRSEEQAECLKEVRQWWEFLIRNAPEEDLRF
jgi:hypothetical protein